MSTLLETIGRTPLVRLGRSLPEAARQATVLAKLEMQNPGGSVKDRISLFMVEDLERSGQITPGTSTIVEYTSGNTGIGLAMVAAAKGYKCIIVMPQMPAMKERYMICRQFGAEVHLTAPKLGVPGMIQYVEQLKAGDPSICCTNQFSNIVNPKTHFETTGPEIWEATGGKVDYLIAGLGTGGTLTGAGKYLRSQNPNCQIICVEPTESRIYGAGAAHSPHTIVGIGAGVKNQFLEPGDANQGDVITEFAHAKSDEAIEWAKQLTTSEGMMVGPSSGATMKVAMEVASRPEAVGQTIVVIFASHGIRYTAHPLWAGPRQEAVDALPAPPVMDPEPLLRWKSP